MRPNVQALMSDHALGTEMGDLARYAARLEAELGEARERLRAVVEAAEPVVCLVDEKSTVLEPVPVSSLLALKRAL